MNKKPVLDQTSNKSEQNSKETANGYVAEDIKLQIVKPLECLAFADNNINVTVHATQYKEHCDHEQILSQFGKDAKVDIVLDDKVVATAKKGKGKKAAYTAKVKLKYTPEGSHKLHAVLDQIDSTKSRKTLKSKPVDFIIDRTRPFIRLTPQDKFLKVKNDGTYEIIIEADDIHSGLDTEKCSLHIDDMVFKYPLELEDGLHFSLKLQLANGKHKVKLVLSDMAGNTIEHDSDILIEKKEAIKPKEEPESKEKANTYNATHPKETLLNNLREKLVIDQQFLKKWLNNPRGTAAEIGIIYTSEMERYLPPSPPNEFIDYSIKTENENVSETLTNLMKRIATAIKKNTVSSLETFKKEGVCKKKGELTNSAKKTIYAILLDPVRMLESVGVTLTEQEKNAIFPPFPKKNAEALVRWISIVQSDKP